MDLEDLSNDIEKSLNIFGDDCSRTSSLLDILKRKNETFLSYIKKFDETDYHENADYLNSEQEAQYLMHQKVLELNFKLEKFCIDIGRKTNLLKNRTHVKPSQLTTLPSISTLAPVIPQPSLSVTPARETSKANKMKPIEEEQEAFVQSPLTIRSITMFLRANRRLCKYIRQYYTVKNEIVQKFDNEIAKQLQSKIKLTGPITVSEYMKEVLTNPVGGYYMGNDVFGETGDFVTSPELSQIFGEMIAIWFLNEWSKAGSPKPIQIVELGPGRGSLCQDILRVFNHFQSLNEASIELIEVSPLLSDLQARKLCINVKDVKDNDSVCYKQGIGHFGTPINWYRRFKDIPNKFTLLIAHEFFDALPIHKFVKTDHGYREVLIDIDVTKDIGFRYVLAKADTPASKLLIGKNEKRDHFEVSPEGIILMKEIASKIESYGGLALIADYGHFGDGTDTFRAYKKHKQHDPLLDVGTADLTADVDFYALKNAATETHDVLAFGPVTQRDFLLKMGIEQRVNKLKESAEEKQIKSIDYSYKMMTNEDQMGRRFKLLSLLPSTLGKIVDKYPVVGFT